MEAPRKEPMAAVLLQQCCVCLATPRAMFGIWNLAHTGSVNVPICFSCKAKQERLVWLLFAIMLIPSIEFLILAGITGNAWLIVPAFVWLFLCILVLGLNRKRLLPARITAEGIRFRNPAYQRAVDALNVEGITHWKEIFKDSDTDSRGSHADPARISKTEVN